MTKKILIAEDDEKIQSFLQEALSNAGYQVLQALDGEETMRLVRSERPHLIILDIVMPKLNGYQICKQIRSDPDPEIAGVKIAVLSGKSYLTDIKTAEKLGVDKYVVKPYSVQELLVVVGDLLKPPS